MPHQRLSNRVRLDLPTVCAVGATAVGLAALFGWITNVRLLATFGSGNIPMAPSTAVLFVLFGLLLLFGDALGRTDGRARTVRALAIAGTVVAALLLVLSSMGVVSDLETLGISLSGTVGGAPIGHMSPITAGGFVLVGVASVSGLTLETIDVGPRRVGMAVSLTVVFSSALLVVAYALGGPLLYGSGVIPPALSTSLAFLLLGVGLLGGSAQHLRKANGGPSFRTPRAATTFTLSLALAGVLILSVAYGYFRVYQADFTAEAGRELSAVANLKAEGVVQWRRERLGDARVLSDNASFGTLVARVVSRSGDIRARRQLHDWLDDIRTTYGYEVTSVLAPDGRPLVAAPDSLAERRLLPTSYILGATSGLRPAFVDFRQAGPQGVARLGVVSPIFDPSNPGHLLAVLYLQIDPWQYLYPFLRQWPSRGARTAVTLLLRREGDEAVLLNDVPGKGTPLQRWASVPDTLVPSVRAVMGQQGVVQGRSRSGMPVEAALRIVPESSWFIEARIDTQEVLAPLRERLWWVVGLAALFFLLVVGGAAITWQDRERRHFRSLAEAEGRERSLEERYRALFNSQRDAILVSDVERRITNYNPAFEALFGYSTGEIVGEKVGLLYESPEAADAASLLAQERQDSPLWVHRANFKTKEGRVFPAEVNVSHLRDTETGDRVGMVGIIRDVTEIRLAEKEREALTAQLTQAQKLESVGRLAGGVAHDFNNMLAVILGHAELALAASGLEDSVREDLSEIRSAADRSARLTRQLLAFARRQIISPAVLDLGESLAGMSKMLRRLIGENIELVSRAEPDLWPVKIDPIQLDQILANLVVNARDAIDGSGHVTIEAGNQTIDDDYAMQHPDALPGDFVVLSVSDDGAGMTSEVMAHLFEPFFTTKPRGEGTGLGLATVYGIVRQNGGFVNVYSEPGRGTTLRIYIPRHASPSPAVDPSPPDPPVGGRETILLVEDESALLRLGTRTLEGLGYRVLSASGPEEALELAGRHGPGISLLLTDVIMPKMSGRELAEVLRERFPALAVLFMSGYAGPILGHVLEEGVQVIQKPFTRVLLSMKIREALERHDS